MRWTIKFENLVELWQLKYKFWLNYDYKSWDFGRIMIIFNLDSRWTINHIVSLLTSSCIKFLIQTCLVWSYIKVKQIFRYILSHIHCIHEYGKMRKSISGTFLKKVLYNTRIFYPFPNTLFYFNFNAFMSNDDPSK